ncbi:MAG: hypothetical protein JSV48_00215, partial [Bradyrhizobium sp.]
MAAPSGFSASAFCSAQSQLPHHAVHDRLDGLVDRDGDDVLARLWRLQRVRLALLLLMAGMLMPRAAEAQALREFGAFAGAENPGYPVPEA